MPTRMRRTAESPETAKTAPVSHLFPTSDYLGVGALSRASKTTYSVSIPPDRAELHAKKDTIYGRVTDVAFFKESHIRGLICVYVCIKMIRGG